MLLTLGEQEVFFNESGQGEAILLLHGWGCDHEIFSQITPIISKKYRVFSLDFPGFGKSPEPMTPWNNDDYANLILLFLKKMEISSCILFGHSFGARIIFKLASRNSSTPLFPKLILTGAAGVKKPPSRWSKSRALCYKTGRIALKPFPRLSEFWRKRHGSADYNAASPLMREVLKNTVNEDLTPLFSKIQQPTLLIWGETDTATPLSDGKIMEKNIPNSGLAVIRDAGHFSFLEKKDLFSNILSSFLELNDKN